MSKQTTTIALASVLAIAAGAHAATAASMGDMYSEAIWDIHAVAPVSPAAGGKLASPDLYREAAWDAGGSVDAPRLAARLTQAQEASKSESPTFRFDSAE